MGASARMPVSHVRYAQCVHAGRGALRRPRACPDGGCRTDGCCCATACCSATCRRRNGCGSPNCCRGGTTARAACSDSWKHGSWNACTRHHVRERTPTRWRMPRRATHRPQVTASGFPWVQNSSRSRALQMASGVSHAIARVWLRTCRTDLQRAGGKQGSSDVSRRRTAYCQHTRLYSRFEEKGKKEPQRVVETRFQTFRAYP